LKEKAAAGGGRSLRLHLGDSVVYGTLDTLCYEDETTEHPVLAGMQIIWWGEEIPYTSTVAAQTLHKKKLYFYQIDTMND